jgi:hypothetical protein
LGEEYKLNGFNMYVRNNSIAAAQGIADFTDSPTAEGFPPTITLTLELTHATGLLKVTDYDPDPSDPCVLLFECHTIRRVSRTYPVKQLYARAQVDFASSPPYTLCTYPNPLPGSAGDYHALVRWYYFDEFDRISKPYSQFAISE